ncbi:MAG: hypothetical protein WD070_07210, partial [Pirellulaceae bacterium]
MVYDDAVSTGGFATGRLVKQRFFTSEGDYNTSLTNRATIQGHDPDADAGEVWSYKYDAFGRQTKVIQDNDGDLVTTSDQRVTKNTYDAQGRLTEVSNDEGIITYAYDDLGRKTSTSIHPANTATPSAATAERVTNYTYDDLGRLKTVVEDLGLPSTLDTAYAYDLLGNLDQTDLPNGVSTDYEY